MYVIVQAASGRKERVLVPPCETDEEACALAVMRAMQDWPGEGWLALHVEN